MSVWGARVGVYMCVGGESWLVWQEEEAECVPPSDPPGQSECTSACSCPTTTTTHTPLALPCLKGCGAASAEGGAQSAHVALAIGQMLAVPESSV